MGVWKGVDRIDINSRTLNFGDNRRIKTSCLCWGAERQ